MANTLNLGNGNWATKEDSLLAYNSENGNFKPLPFDFTRASSATVVNKAGLIETVGSGEPRIDFSNDAKGALLLEPQRLQLVDNSSNFFVGGWSGTRTSEGSTINAPNGNNEAHKLIASSVNNSHFREYTASSASSGSYTGSCFFKKGEFNVGAIRMSVDSYANRIGVYINLDNGTHLQTSTVGSPTGTSYKIEDYGNGWYRLSVSIIHTSGQVRMSLSNASSDYTNSNGLPVFLGNSSDGGYSWGAQLEQGSYATSYIPTSGSAVTRVADVCTNGANEQAINSTEGVLYAEANVFEGSDDVFAISLSDGSSTNRIFLTLESPDSKYRAYSTGGGDLTFQGLDVTSLSKVAVRYSLNNFSLWVNGIKRFENLTYAGIPSNTLNNLSFDRNGIGELDFRGNVKDVRVYNTALTDSELATLTTI